MKHQRLYEGFTSSICLTVLGVELTGFAAWYFLQVSQNPYQIFRQTLVITIPLAVFILFIAWITGQTVTKRRSELGISLPETRSFIQYLKFSRMWVVIVGVIVVMPVVLLITVWLALHSSDAGVARRNPRNMMVYLIGLGPILTLMGVGDMVYTAAKIMYGKIKGNEY